MPAFIRGRGLRERASYKSPSRDVEKRLAALFAIEFSIGSYPILPRYPHHSQGESADEGDMNSQAQDAPDSRSGKHRVDAPV